MTDVGPILAELRKAAHLTQRRVAERLEQEYGIRLLPATVSNWEKGVSVPNADQFLALCGIYQVRSINGAFRVRIEGDPLALLNDAGLDKVYDYADLLVRSGLYDAPHAEVVPFTRKIPLYLLEASAGTGQFVDSDAYEMIEVGSEVSPAADFGVTLAGDSMEPLYVNGQTVWVHQQEVLRSGDIGIFWYDGNAFCKKYRETGGQIRLISLNPKYDPIPVREERGFKIFGRVVQ